MVDLGTSYSYVLTVQGGQPRHPRSCFPLLSCPGGLLDQRRSQAPSAPAGHSSGFARNVSAGPQPLAALDVRALGLCARPPQARSLPARASLPRRECACRRPGLHQCTPSLGRGRRERSHHHQSGAGWAEPGEELPGRRVGSTYCLAYASRSGAPLRAAWNVDRPACCLPYKGRACWLWRFRSMASLRSACAPALP